MKSFFQRTTTPTSHCTKANAQLQFSSAITFCELAVHLFFFEKISVLRLHYGNPFAPIQSLFAGVLQAKPVSADAAGSFCKIAFDRALNRPRSPEVRKPLVCFLVLFARRKKNVKTSPLQEASRFCKPRTSPPQPQLRTATIKTFPKGNPKVLQTSNQRTKTTNPYNSIKSFCRPRRLFFCCLRQQLPPSAASFTAKGRIKALPWRQEYCRK